MGGWVGEATVWMARQDIEEGEITGFFSLLFFFFCKVSVRGGILLLALQTVESGHSGDLL